MKNKLLIALLLTASVLFGQKSEIKNDPGYVDFGNLSVFDQGDMVAEVLIEDHLLRMVAKMMKQQDPELYDMLNGLKLIKVNAFDANEKNKKEIIEIINKVDAQLIDKGWDRIVKVRDRKERAYIYIRTQNEDDILGLVVMAIGDDNEAAFVNIVGKINLETIGRLSEKFDIPELDKVNSKEKVSENK